MSGRRSATMLCALCLYLHCSVRHGVAAMSWSCSLTSNPVETIPYPVRQDPAPKEGDGRRLRSSTREDAIALFGDHAGRRLGEDTGNHTSSSPDQSRQGRECTCAGGMLPTEATYYCPTPNDHCAVWMRRYSNQYKVTCYEFKDWKVGFARSIWYYLCFALLMVVMYPIFSTPGHHVIRYLLSKCFPRMNPWITEQLLRTEVEMRNRMNDQVEHAARVKRQTEGWVSGYSIKTKLFSSGDKGTESSAGSDDKIDKEDGSDNADQGSIDEENDSNKADQSSIGEPQDRSIVSTEDNNMCTICLLAVEDGERVADLSCGHLYHAECLGEWILKKNTCPLCQNEDIAKEIRSFETEDDGNNDDAPSGGCFTRLRRQARDTARESFLDLATGRDRRRDRMILLNHRFSIQEATTANQAANQTQTPQHNQHAEADARGWGIGMGSTLNTRWAGG